ncbi:MAG: hypothetical protein A4C66_07240 [Nitrospira sp. HN-bin3]|nr:MAG: hypothetical protein A4C66_07240 [Nitrospira sp. HN-bin3]
MSEGHSSTSVDGAVRECGFFSVRVPSAALVRITTAHSPYLRMDGGQGVRMFDHPPIFVKVIDIACNECSGPLF